MACCARASKDGTRLLYGGKGQGNDVKMVDIEHEGKLVWKAKPPPVNWLNYRAPPWVKCASSKSAGKRTEATRVASLLSGRGRRK